MAREFCLDGDTRPIGKPAILTKRSSCGASRTLGKFRRASGYARGAAPAFYD